jgi:hypothetical protein
MTQSKTETEDERKARLKAERDKKNEKRIKFVDSRFDKYNGDTLVLSK